MIGIPDTARSADACSGQLAAIHNGNLGRSMPLGPDEAEHGLQATALPRQHCSVTQSCIASTPRRENGLSMGRATKVQKARYASDLDRGTRDPTWRDTKVPGALIR